MGLDIGLIDLDQLSRQLFIRPCAAVIFAPNSRVKSVRRITTIAKFNITSSAPNAALGNTESKTQPSREVIIVGTQNISVTITANNNAEMNLLLSRSIMISWAQDTAITGDRWQSYDLHLWPRNLNKRRRMIVEQRPKQSSGIYALESVPNRRWLDTRRNPSAIRPAWPAKSNHQLDPRG